MNFSVSGNNNGGQATTFSEQTPLKDLINQLTFIVYQQSGEEYVRRTQFSTDTAFGNADLNLPLGTYTLVAVGSKSHFGINQYFRDATTEDEYLPLSSGNMQYLQATKFMGEKIYKTGDTFFAKKQISINNSTDVNLVLDRIVGKLEVTVEDKDDYYVIITNEATGYLFDAETSYNGIQLDYWNRVNNGKKTYCGYFLRTDKPLQIELYSGGKTKELSVPIYKNRVTVLRGKFSGPTKLPEFNVTINDKWSTDTAKVSF